MNCQECDDNQNGCKFPSYACYKSEEQKATANSNDSDKFKTKLCTHFMTTGTCFYGAKCHFAHGKHELRRNETSEPLVHPRHKTTLCQNELRYGACKFGKGCNFIHKDDPEYQSLRQQISDHQNTLQSPESSHESLESSHQSEPETWGSASIANESTSPPTSILSGLFIPMRKIFKEIREPTSFTPGTPLTSSKPVSYEDRRSSAATVWGAISPRVAVWEQRLRGSMRM